MKAPTFITHIDKVQFGKALGSAAAVAKGRTTLPILSYTLLEATDGKGKLRVTCTNLDCFYTSVMEADVETPGSCLIPTTSVREWLGVMREVGPLQITGDQAEVGFALGTQRIVLKTLPAPDFPPCPRLTLTGKPLLRADFGPLKHVVDAAHKDVLADKMNNLFVEREGAGLVAFACDGKRGGLVTFPMAPFAWPDAEQQILIHKDMAGHIQRLGDCSLYVSSSYLGFDNEHVEFHCRRPEARPVPWREMLKSLVPQATCTVSREELLAAIGAGHCLRGPDDHTRILFSDDEDGIKLTAETQFGKFQGLVMCRIARAQAHDGSGLTAWDSVELPSEHLLAFLNQQDEEIIGIDFNDKEHAVRMIAGPVTFLFMPFIQRVAATK